MTLTQKSKRVGKAVAALIIGTTMLVPAFCTTGFMSANADSATQASNGLYKTDYDSVTEVLDEMSALNERIGEEGFVLLKNEANNLPFSSRVRNISLFGRNAYDPVYMGSGSSGTPSGTIVDVQQSLKNAGFRVNPVLADFYGDKAKRNTFGTAWTTGETAMDKYTDDDKA